MKIERQTVHVSDDSGRIAMLEKRTLGTDPSPASLLRYIYSNRLQSASLELDENAAIISYEEYHPYGTTSYQAMNASINAVAKRYRYTGKERDGESGLYYHGARYYIPWLCRWTAVDPLESKYAGMSPYNYAFNNPVMYNDPSGANPGKPKNAGTQEGQREVTSEKIYKKDPEGGGGFIYNAAVWHWHIGSDNYNRGWYKEATYAAMNREIFAGIIYASDELALGSNNWGGQEAKMKAAKAAYGFIEAYKDNISADFFQLLSKQAGSIIKEYQWEFGGKQSGIVYLTDSPIDYFAGGFLKSLSTFAAKGSQSLGNIAFKGTISSINALTNRTTMKLVQEGLQDSLKGLYMKALPSGGNTVKHHIFNVFRGKSPASQKYRDFFQKHNIDLDAHTVHIPENLHKQLHKAGNNWTTKWKQWIDANPNATTKEVYQQAGRMMDDYGISRYTILPYK